MTVACPLPAAPALTGFEAALDAATVRDLVTRFLLQGAELLSLEPYYVRFKGVDGGLVAWRLTLASAGGQSVARVTLRAAPPVRLENEAARLRNRAGEVYGHLTSHALAAGDGVLLIAFPVDRVLGDLRRIVRASKIRRMLSTHAPDLAGPNLHVSKRQSSLEVVRYKPERRAVLKWNLALVDIAGERSGERGIYVRLHSEHIAKRVVRATAAARRGGLRCPEPVAVPHPGLILESDLAGSVARGLDPEQARAAGAELARLHGVAQPALPVRHAIDELDVVLSAQSDLESLDPGLGDLAAGVAAELSRWIPSPTEPCFLHGDYHAGQVLFGAGPTGLVDFDRTHAGHAAYDLASFVVKIGESDPDRGRLLCGAFEQGYAEHHALPPRREHDWFRACALLRAAMTPFRELRPDWPARARAWIEAAAATAAEVRVAP